MDMDSRFSSIHSRDSVVVMSMCVYTYMRICTNKRTFHTLNMGTGFCVNVAHT